jgi:hypothetical protein
MESNAKWRADQSSKSNLQKITLETGRDHFNQTAGRRNLNGGKIDGARLVVISHNLLPDFAMGV